jgi:hypothetical protein
MSEQAMNNTGKAENTNISIGAGGAKKGVGDEVKPLGVWFLFVGVIYPALVILIEWGTRMCAMEFFDPMPGYLHAALVLAAPFGNLIVYMASRGSIQIKPLWIGAAAGLALTVSAWYTILFLPLIPLALVGILMMGLGLLPLAPPISLICAIIAARRFKRIHGVSHLFRAPGLVKGVALGMFLLFALNIQVGITRMAMSVAANNEDPDRRSFAIRALRKLGDSDLLLRSCYRRTGVAGSPLGLFIFRGQWVSTSQARTIYYRVMGEPFNSAPVPTSIAGRSGFFGMMGFDRGLGGDSVADKVPGLSLNGSRLDGSIDGEAALGYLEWTLVFKNDTMRQQEARAILALPPGAVVSRLTLWVDGEEREAVFAKKNLVKKAYKNIVRRKRDPVLITTVSPDRVLMRLFPVPPQGGLMKVRVGVTAPLYMNDMSHAALKPPRIIERNFEIADSFTHSVWIESKDELENTIKSLVVERPNDELYAIRGAVSDAELLDHQFQFTAGRNAEVKRVRATDSIAGSNNVVIQDFTKNELAKPKNVVLVIDGSSCMREHRTQLIEAVSKIPDGTSLTMVAALDEPVRIPEKNGDTSSSARDEVVAFLKSMSFNGGFDNVKALSIAGAIAMSRRDCVVIWIHGPQPVLLSSPESILQMKRRRPGAGRIYSIETASGINKIADELGYGPAYTEAPRWGSLARDLYGIIGGQDPSTGLITASRKRVEESELQGSESFPETSDHLARLWANDRIMKLYRSQDKKGLKEAVSLANQYRLVTPVSGAVVLETDKDYVRAGLEPPGDVKVPSIPEPETWALIIIALMVLAFATLRRRRMWGCP